MNIKRVLPVACAAFLAVFVAGCQTYEHRYGEEAPNAIEVDRVAVLGFRSLPFSFEEGQTVRSPLTGSVFMGGHVPREITQELTYRVYQELSKKYSAELVPPEEAWQAQGALNGTRYEFDEREVLIKIGESLASDAVLAGYVYRWRERQGTDYAVSRPASVAFELALVKVADGSIIWKSRFDKTQASLTENILDLGTFLKGKGRWMTVHELAGVGLSDLLARLPIEKRNNQ